MGSSALDSVVRAWAAELRRTDCATPQGRARRRDRLQAYMEQAAQSNCPVSAAALRELLPALRSSRICAVPALAVMALLLYESPDEATAARRALVIAEDSELLAALAACLDSVDCDVASFTARFARQVILCQPARRAVAAAEPACGLLAALVRFLLRAAPRAAPRALLPRDLPGGGAPSGALAEQVKTAGKQLECLRLVFAALGADGAAALLARLGPALRAAAGAQLFSADECIAYCALQMLNVIERYDKLIEPCARQQFVFIYGVAAWRRAEAMLLRDRIAPPPAEWAARAAKMGLDPWRLWPTALNDAAHMVYAAARTEYAVLIAGLRRASRGRAPPPLLWAYALDRLVLQEGRWRALIQRLQEWPVAVPHTVEFVRTVVQLAASLQLVVPGAGGGGTSAAGDAAAAEGRRAARARLESDWHQLMADTLSIRPREPGGVLQHDLRLTMHVMDHAKFMQRFWFAVDAPALAPAPKPPRACAACGRTKADGAESVKRCRGCGELTGVRYCSVACARVHWTTMGHKTECQDAQQQLANQREIRAWHSECGAANVALLEELGV